MALTHKKTEKIRSTLTIFAHITYPKLNLKLFKSQSLEELGKTQKMSQKSDFAKFSHFGILFIVYRGIAAFAGEAQKYVKFWVFSA